MFRLPEYQLLLIHSFSVRIAFKLRILRPWDF